MEALSIYYKSNAVRLLCVRGDRIQAAFLFWRWLLIVIVPRQIQEAFHDSTLNITSKTYESLVNVWLDLRELATGVDLAHLTRWLLLMLSKRFLPSRTSCI